MKGERKMMSDYRNTLGASGLARYIKAFGRHEGGSMTIFGLFMFLCIIVMVGMGVDVMRYEKERTHLQNTLDRAVLAAADLDQRMDPETVVRDYFAKAGLSDSLTGVNVVSTLGSREVTATAEVEVNTLFMQMTGVDTLSIANISTARESIDAVEISLVLDVSGSMRNYSRLTNLKVAAKDFIDDMFNNSVEDTVSISIVPYATQVSAPQELFDQLNVSQEHNYSRCINFEAAEFNNTTISTTQEYQRTMHFDPWDNFDGRDNDPVEMVRNPICEADASREMILLSDDRDDLKNFIDGFFADGNTSLDLGMKWGSILVDPSFQPIAQALSDPAIGLIDPKFANRPVAYSDTETLKVVVLMTDGQNTSQYYMEDGFREGNSSIWWNEQEEFYSVYLGEDVDDDNNNGLTDDPLYYWPYDSNVAASDGYHDHAYGEGSYEETETAWECRRYRRNGSCRRWREVTTTVTVNEPGSAELVSYPDLWAFTSMKRVVDKLFEPIAGNDAWSDWYYDVRSSYGTSTKNTRTEAMCDAAKNNGTIVYTIAFESPDASRTLLRECATADINFFQVPGENGLDINDAFSAIASSIRALRLTL